GQSAQIALMLKTLLLLMLPSVSKVLLNAASTDPKYFFAVVSLITTELGLINAVASPFNIFALKTRKKLESAANTLFSSNTLSPIRRKKLPLSPVKLYMETLSFTSGNSALTAAPMDCGMNA